MEAITLILNRPVEYDAAVRTGQPQASPITIVSKEAGTAGGNPVVVVAFHSEVDGHIVLVQATTTLALLLSAAGALAAAHGGNTV